MRPLAVFDIDGVLADVTHRLHHLRSRPRDWRAFFAEADRDGPLQLGIELLHRYERDLEIRYLTGRPERLRAVTGAWLRRHGLPDGPIAMRGNRDFRPSRLFKTERLRRWMAEGSRIAVVVDDDPAVVDAIAELGLRVILADWQSNAPSAVLHAAQERPERP